MPTQQFTSIANRAIDSFDTNAHRLITAWHDASERLGDAAKERWDIAFEESKPQLSAQTRRNAQHARKVFGGYYTQGIAMSTTAAAIGVDTLVQVARVALQRSAAWKQARA